MDVDPWQVSTGLLAALAGTVAYLGRTQVSVVELHSTQIADHGERLIRLEERLLTREALKAELSEVEHRIMIAISASDRHQSEAIGRVDAKASEGLKRADDLQRIINGA